MMYDNFKPDWTNSKRLWPKFVYSVGLLGLEIAAFATRHFVNGAVKSVSLGERIGQWLDEIGHGEPFEPHQTIALILVLSIAVIGMATGLFHLTATILDTGE
jgi:hypothetical protein